MTGTEIAIEVIDLCCARGGRMLFAGIHFRLGPGELLQLSGANGSGKTTLLTCLAGMTTDFQGSVSMPARQSTFVGHRAGISAYLTVAENLQWYAALYGIKADHGQIGAALQAVQMADRARNFAADLSAGQRQRLALARLQLTQARIWLLDEPTATLDQDGVRMVRGLCENHLRTGGLAVISTHQEMDFDEHRKIIHLDGGCP